jgi:hypothetical protein
MPARNQSRIGIASTRKDDLTQNRELQNENDIARTYNKLKQFDGKKYTGMKVGGSHRWYYDKGEWKEKKVSPDKWEFSYAATKRRAGHAPEGSGVPVGTEYHWYILAHQSVRKLDANNYSTSMSGLKYKLGYKRAEKDNWSSTDRTQRKKLVQILKDLALQIEQET